jgi:protein phosphatase 1 regulatory subunit 11
MTSTARRPQTSAPGDGSRTITVRDSQPVPEDGSAGQPADSNILRLRGGPRSRPRVMWDADVIDNEGCGKKKSKSTLLSHPTTPKADHFPVCCIYHKPKAFDESSDESSDDSDASCGSNDSRTKPRHSHNHSHGHDGESISRPSGNSNTTTFHPDPGPNAYEKSTPGSKGKQKGMILSPSLVTYVTSDVVFLF